MISGGIEVNQFAQIRFTLFSITWHLLFTKHCAILAGNYMFKVNNGNTRTRSETWRCSDVFIVYSEHMSHLVLVFLLLTLST